MKKRLLLIVIYLAFIGLGLPDSLLGSAWPAIYADLGAPIHFAGIISMVVAGGTVVSSLYSVRVIDRFGVANVTVFSVLMTALALLGFSYAQHVAFLFLLAVPLGLGAGSVDAGLNNYVALHYKASHMNWLHCFWGLGAATGPVIMAAYLADGRSWTAGYHTVGWIQLFLVAVLFASIPLWMKRGEGGAEEGRLSEKAPFSALLKIPGVKHALAVFFCYCSIEATFGLWGASYLVFARNFEAEEAARYVALYYVGITFGRFLSGFLTEKLNNWQMVRLGQGTVVLGLVILFLPFKAVLLPGFFLIGLGCAPVFPSLLHETPRSFGEKNAQAIMGMQMAAAYVGIVLMPLLFGRLASYAGHALLLWFIGTILALKIYMAYSLRRKVR